MKHILTAAVAWLSADPVARFAPRHVARDSSALSNNSPESSTSSADPDGAQAQQSHQVVLIESGQTQVVPPPSTGLGSALYTMTNTDGGNNVILAFALNSGDGKVNTSAPVARYIDNNGTGLRLSSTTSNLQYALDSQDSLAQAGARLFAVNAGSSTFRAWAINCTNATNLIPLGGAVATNGKNPTTLAIAQENEIVCVGTTGAGSGIECYTYSTGFTTSEITPPQFFTGTKVSLPLPVAQSGAKPSGPADTISQLLFTDDESHLIAVVKGQVDSTGKVTASGYINIYPITSKGLGTPVQSKPAGTKLLYGCTLQFNTFNLFCADAGVGAVFLTSQSDLTYKVTVSTLTSTFGNGTNGWTARSPFSNGPDYISPVDKNYIAAFDKSGKYIASTNFATSNQIGGSNPQVVELTTAANYIYGLSFGSTSSNSQHILVVQDVGLKGGLNAVQNVAINSIANSAGVSNALSGLAVFIPPKSDSTDACDFQ